MSATGHFTLTCSMCTTEFRLPVSITMTDGVDGGEPIVRLRVDGDDLLDHIAEDHAEDILAEASPGGAG